MKAKTLVCLLALTFSLLISSSTFAIDPVTVSAGATVTVGAACSLSSVVDTEHTATINPGTNHNDIGKTTFTVVCNDAGGYSIYAVGYGNFEVGNNKLIADFNGTPASTYDINTGTNTSGSPSSWAMKLTPSTNLTASNILNGYGSYNLVPASYTKVVSLVPSTTVANPTSFEATYRVNIASNQPAGTYNGKVRYVMVNPATNVPNEPKACSENKICYWPNAGNEVNDSMGDQSTNYSDNTNTITSNMDVNLWPSNFKRTGYGFAGWSDAYDYVANVGSESNPDAHIYGPMETIHLNDMSDGLSLYAVWVKSEGNLQNWNGCSSLGQGRVTALTDLRDNDTYAVAKLADGNCWMIENLRLDYDADFTESLSQGFGKSTTYGNFIGLAEPETLDKFYAGTSGSDVTAATPANSLYYAGTQSGTARVDVQQNNYAGYRIPRYNNDNTKTSNLLNSPIDGVDQNIYSYGNYYNYPAAKANTTPLNSVTDSTATYTSICPSSWRLPSGHNSSSSSSGDFGLLSNSLGGKNDNGIAKAMTASTEPTGAAMSKILRSFPNNFLYSGSVYNGSFSNRGSYARYSTSTTGNGSSSNPTTAVLYVLQFYKTNAQPGVYLGTKYSGYTIRCVFYTSP